MLLKCNERSCCPKQHLIFFFLQGQLFSDGNNPVIPCHQESRENSSTLRAALGALGEGKTVTKSCLGALSSKETFSPTLHFWKSPGWEVFLVPSGCDSNGCICAAALTADVNNGKGFRIQQVTLSTHCTSLIYVTLT